MQLIDGKTISAKVKEEVKNEAAQLTEKGVIPCLAVILVGDDKASQTYVNSKEKACKACGIRSLKYTLEANTSESALIDLIQSLNEKAVPIGYTLSYKKSRNAGISKGGYFGYK